MAEPIPLDSRRLADAALAASRQRPEPTLLVGTPPPAEPYPLEALGPLTAPATAIQKLTQAPAAIAAQSVLCAVAVAAQGLADVELLLGHAPLSLYALTVAESGERKSTCDRFALGAIREYERELAHAYRPLYAAFKDQHAVWTARRKALVKKAITAADPARDELEILGCEPEPPLKPLLITGDPTVEGLVKHAKVLRPALGLISDEAGQLLGGAGFKTEGRMRSLAAFSTFWDGAPVDRLRAGDDVQQVAGRRLSMHLMIQPVIAETLFGDDLARRQGFLPRFLIAHPQSTIGTRLGQGPAPDSQAALAQYEARLGRLLRAPLPLREGTRTALDPRLLGLSPGARDRLTDFADEVEGRQAPGGDLEDVRAFASKAAEQAARLAGVLTLYEAHDAAEVSAEHMANGIALARFYLREAARVMAVSAISQETLQLEQLRRWLINKWDEPCISATDAAQSGPFKDAPRIRVLLFKLEDEGWLALEPEGAMIRGKRRREAWRIHLGEEAS